MDRRRFLTITAGAAAAGLLPPGRATALSQWRGVALGAEAAITLDHPEAARLMTRARAEIDRLEAVFSLYRPASALSQLNATGALAAPPFELLECLSLAGRVHDSTGGAFDPTIQPLWALYARHAAEGGRGYPPEPARRATLARVGWPKVQIDAAEIRLAPGMALSLNGIAQGYIADRVAALLRAEGLTDVLVNTGEMRALGGNPRGGAWQVQLRADETVLPGPMPLSNAALASSAPLGTAFDPEGTVGHILDPRTGQPGDVPWRLITVTAPQAAQADALSTGFSLMSRAEIDTALEAWPDARLVQALI